MIMAHRTVFSFTHPIMRGNNNTPSSPSPGAAALSPFRRSASDPSSPATRPPAPLTRRVALFLAPAAVVLPALLAQAPPPAAASLLIDETEAQRVYASSRASVLALYDVVRPTKASPREEREFVGSATVWDAERGLLVTNYHVAGRLARDKSGEQVTVAVTGDGRELRATVIGAAPSYDLAVLRVDAAPGELAAPRIAPGGDYKVGQRAYAIALPGPLTASASPHSMSVGLISGLDRSIPVGSGTGQRLSGVLQTDCDVPALASGGGLFDSQGRLVGLLTSVRTSSGGSTGVNFALPSDILYYAVPRLIVCQTVSPKCN
jgi:S1-C subfamily serine protease